jgi:hypothetical protein
LGIDRWTLAVHIQLIYAILMNSKFLRFVRTSISVAYSGILFRGGGSTNSVQDRGQREWGSGGIGPLVSGYGGSCNLVQEISLHIVKFS